MNENNRRDLVGDGVHDDTAGIQQLLDERRTLVFLPSPSKAYRIRRPLRIHSGQTLSLDRGAVIRLADKSDCVMVTNGDHAGGNRDISLIGGIWDCNNRGQATPEKPCTGTAYDPERHLGMGLRFNRVVNLRIADLTVKDPGAFGMQLGNLEQFTVENIVFDYNMLRECMDGVHVHGNSRFGRIANIKGATNDDQVALNADDGSACEMSRGPLSDIQVDGVFAENGYTAVRLLSAGSPVSRIRLSNLFGTYRYHVVSFTHHDVHPGAPSTFEDVLIDGVFCSKPLQPLDNPLRGDHWACGALPQVVVKSGCVVRSLHIRNLHRTESYHRPPDTLLVESGASAEHLCVSDCSFVNRSDRNRNFLTNEGEIGWLTMNNVRCRAEGGVPRGLVLDNRGRIGQADLTNIRLENFLGAGGA
jgi:hypothetical protein